MGIVIKILQFLMSFSLLILIHEFGHFIAARMFKIKVEKFYLFFNPWFSLVRIRGKQTEFGIGWVPLGGYCKIAGMIDESMDKEQLKQPPQPDEYRSRPAGQRLLVVSGGVIMNIVLAFCIYTGINYVWGEHYTANSDVRYGYVFSETGRAAGFQNGDKIVNINGRQIENTRRFPLKMLARRNAVVEVDRGGQRTSVTISDDLAAQMLTEPLLSPRIPFVVDSLMSDGGAAAAGILSGDSLVAVGGTAMDFADQFQDAFQANKGQTVDVTLVRDSAGVDIEKTLPVAISASGTIGVFLSPSERFIPETVITYNFWQAIPASFKRTGTEVADYWTQFKLMFRPHMHAGKHLGGPIGIANMYRPYWDFEAFWSFTAFLSIVLAVMNILPIPGLDGGHIMFLAVEVVTRRKPSDKFLERAQMVGMILILALILFATSNDIQRIFFRH